MSVTDANVVEGSEGRLSHQARSHSRSLPISQTDEKVFTFTPGYNFEIVGFSVYTDAITAAVTTILKKGTTAVTAAVTPVADTEVKGTILVVGNQYGSATDTINVHMTSDGSGILTDATVTVLFRRRARDK